MRLVGGMQDWPLRLMRIIDHAALNHGSRDIVTHWADGSETRTSWAEVAHDARRLASSLEKLGVHAGDRVGTLAMNHSRHLVAWYGIVGMGGVVHTINPRLFDDQIVYIANHGGDRVLFYDAAFSEQVERLKPRFETIQEYICFDDHGGADGAFEAMLARGDEDNRWVEGDERAPAMLCYTSGTTGDPKGVLYEHRSMTLITMGLVAPDAFDLSARAVILPVVPMFHANAWALPYCAGMVGAKLVLSAVNDVHVLQRLLIREGVTHCAGVPTIWLAILADIDKSRETLGGLRVAIVGGSAVPRSMIQSLMKAGIRVLHSWGMTELSPTGTIVRHDADWDNLDFEMRLARTMRQGQSLFGVEMRSVDDNGVEVDRDGRSIGRLQVRGAWVLERYYGAEGNAVDGDGWFDTGDIGLIHPDGSMQITDRAKDVIKSGGEWISSIELENEANGCPGVAEAAAIGIPDPRWGERPLLLVVPTESAKVTEAQVRDHLAARVAKWWMPESILILSSLPHTGTGKIHKALLREQYEAGLYGRPSLELR